MPGEKEIFHLAYKVYYVHSGSSPAVHGILRRKLVTVSTGMQCENDSLFHAITITTFPWGHRDREAKLSQRGAASHDMKWWFLSFSNHFGAFLYGSI